VTDAVPFDPVAVPEPGRAVALSPLVVRATAPNPGVMTGPGTNTYLVGTDELVVIDPGPDDADHRHALVTLGATRIRWIVVTHTHPDHAPGAAALAVRTGAQVLGFSERDGFVPDRAVGDGFELNGSGFVLRAVHTPGHASNHLCWLLVEDRMLFSGDHVMQGSTVVIAPPDGDMARYLASLRLLLAIAPPLATIAPGHGSLIVDPEAALEGIIEHRLVREKAVADALARAGRATVDELLPTVYADVDEALHPVARYSLWAHLRKLDADGAAHGEDPTDIEAHWAAIA
jgi:glyoxylase-like metal-dependent hydrolase (beta-lactamase superfamily II)